MEFTSPLIAIHFLNLLRFYSYTPQLKERSSVLEVPTIHLSPFEIESHSNTWRFPMKGNFNRGINFYLDLSLKANLDLVPMYHGALGEDILLLPEKDVFYNILDSKIEINSDHSIHNYNHFNENSLRVNSDIQKHLLKQQLKYGK